MADVFHGIGVSSGVAVGQVLLLPTEALPVVPTPVPPERVEEEIGRFEQAREEARAELTTLRDKIRGALGAAYAGILDAQLLILEDPRLRAETSQRIRVGRITAGWALKEVVAGFLRAFEAVDDGYLRERGGDLDDVHRRLQRLLHGPATRQTEMPDGPVVIVAHTLGPSEASMLSQRHVVGLATDVGGPTSHTAILAQALSIPAVVGLHDVSGMVETGAAVVLDGDAGTVEILPDERHLEEARRRQQALRLRDRELKASSREPARTRDGVPVTVRANIEFPREVETALDYGSQGIGLYRSEFLFLTRSPALPTEEEHYETYRRIGESVAPNPAIVRTLDLGGEKYFHAVLDRDEANPVLGLRAIRLCLKRPDIFRPQIRGILRAAAHAPLSMMIPLVTTSEEVRAVRRMVAREAEALAAEGVEARGDLPIGIMVEVPAAAAAADLLARESDFFSIGTNDLIQYSLAVDRGNDSVNYLYQPLHPAVLRMLRFTIESARQAGIPVALCGEMAADPALAALLVGLGLRELSVQPRAIGRVREAIRVIRADEAAGLAEQALQRSTAEEVAACLAVFQPVGRDGS